MRPAAAPPAAVALTAEQKGREAGAIRAAARCFWQATDPAERARLFTPDAWVVWELDDGREPMLLGRDAILARLRTGPGELARVRTGLLRVADAGDQAYEYGVLHRDHEAADRASRGPVVAHFVRTWRRIDGRWLVDTEVVRRAPAADADDHTAPE